jgi:hypothetical protein
MWALWLRLTFHHESSGSSCDQHPVPSGAWKQWSESRDHVHTHWSRHFLRVPQDSCLRNDLFWNLNFILSFLNFYFQCCWDFIPSEKTDYIYLYSYARRFPTIPNYTTAHEIHEEMSVITIGRVIKGRNIRIVTIFRRSRLICWILGRFLKHAPLDSIRSISPERGQPP